MVCCDISLEECIAFVFSVILVEVGAQVSEIESHVMADDQSLLFGVKPLLVLKDQRFV